MLNLKLLEESAASERNSMEAVIIRKMAGDELTRSDKQLIEENIKHPEWGFHFNYCASDEIFGTFDYYVTFNAWLVGHLTTFNLLKIAARTVICEFEYTSIMINDTGSGNTRKSAYNVYTSTDSEPFRIKIIDRTAEEKEEKEEPGIIVIRKQYNVSWETVDSEMLDYLTDSADELGTTITYDSKFIGYVYYIKCKTDLLETLENTHEFDRTMGKLITWLHENAGIYQDFNPGKPYGPTYIDIDTDDTTIKVTVFDGGVSKPRI